MRIIGFYTREGKHRPITARKFNRGLRFHGNPHGNNPHDNRVEEIRRRQEACKHEWVQPWADHPDRSVQVATLMLRECKICGKPGKLLKCKKCNNYTVHTWVSARDIFGPGNPRAVERWKCYDCGTEKTVTSVRGSKPGWGMAHPR